MISACSIRKNISLLILTLMIPIFAAQYKSGVITKNEFWVADQGPYIITDDILIEKDVRVVVAAGAKILIEQPLRYTEQISQLDLLDSTTIAINVRGVFKCIGKPNNHIVIQAKNAPEKKYPWYGIIIDSRRSKEIEIAYTEISMACNAITIINCEPLVRNTLFKMNNIGIIIRDTARPLICNNMFTYCQTAAIRVKEANPQIINNIFYSNPQLDIWGDNISVLQIEYNCFAATSQPFLYCNPRLGVLDLKEKKPVDGFKNLFTDPLFKNSVAESLYKEKDLAVPTKKESIKDKLVASIVEKVTKKNQKVIAAHPFDTCAYWLSPYSPCIDAGSPLQKFKDTDGTRNDMGIFGGNEIFDMK